jgi:ketosteroid isomerase-like protein
MRIAVLAVAILAAASGVGLSRVSQPPSQSPSDTSAIRAARQDQNRAIRDRDLDRAATYWTPDIIVLAGLGARVRGIDSLKAAFGADGRIVYERIPSDVRVSAGWPLAWETGTWTGKDRTSSDAILITGRYSAQWVRTDQGWKIRSELFVADRCFREACRWPLATK